MQPVIRATPSTQGADIAPDGDEDQDGLPDYWEQANGTNPLVNDLQSDPDLDGLTNGAEHSIGPTHRTRTLTTAGRATVLSSLA